MLLERGEEKKIREGNVPVKDILEEGGGGVISRMARKRENAFRCECEKTLIQLFESDGSKCNVPGQILFVDGGPRATNIKNAKFINVEITFRNILVAMVTKENGSKNINQK